MRRPWQEPALEKAPGFEDFVRERSPRLLSMARGLMRSSADAEDLVQDVLAKVLLRWDVVSRADDPNAYVNRMLVNAATSFWRRGFQRESPTDSEILGDRPVEDASGTLAERDALLRALATLKPKHRAVLVLRYYEGLNDHEIAATLGMAHASVRSNAARGLAALRRAGLLTSRV
ncbi:SigE family RNA polymerase sigma factor [Kineosporia succinea]|uniref:RNA polymerase sigma-70 factor (Sigma-E family) n=1 Tax=Kineosporia succinea TaxID=84632 RepID=A0ABT9P8W5_9ACTN|nr:SigE family RNA polymerase sigma factor [Kineosporia succinea]MDP9829134.1 RNA polymerase sigma-70 factor (sigma-E family) [Kineosporia succinea]